MKRIKLLGLVLIALFALSAVASSVAMAEVPEILPLPTTEKPLKFTSKTTGVSTLETTGGLKIECEKGTNKGSFTTANKGTVTIDFEVCKETSSKAKCTSTGETVAGTILLEGPATLVDVLPTGTLDLGILILPLAIGGLASAKDLEFKCGVLTVLILGSVLGHIDNLKKELLISLEKAKVVLALFKQTKGEQDQKTCDLPEATCKGQTFELKAKIKTETAEELAGQLADAEIEFEKEVEVHF